jgi:hypothetical protein
MDDYLRAIVVSEEDDHLGVVSAKGIRKVRGYQINARVWLCHFLEACKQCPQSVRSTHLQVFFLRLSVLPETMHNLDFDKIPHVFVKLLPSAYQLAVLQVCNRILTSQKAGQTDS